MSTAAIDTDSLEARGYIVLRSAVEARLLAEFEATIDALARAQVARTEITPTAAEPLIDLLRIGGEYRKMLFGLLRNLYVLHKMTAAIGERLDAAGFFRWSLMAAPLYWPTLRADLPGEQTYLLDMHQDVKSTRCHTAWRMWVPLRPVDERRGTMKLVPESHALGPLPHDLTDPASYFVPERHYRGLPVETLSLPAGSAVLMNPLIVHGSVPSQSARMKYVLLIQIQDLATMVDPRDADEPLTQGLHLARLRDAAREVAE